MVNTTGSVIVFDLVLTLRLDIRILTHITAEQRIPIHILTVIMYSLLNTTSLSSRLWLRSFC